MKVYELAKDLKIRSVDLVDKLRRQWNIPVKNHMQKLHEQDLKKIRSFLEKEQQKMGVKKKLVSPLIRRSSSRTTDDLSVKVESDQPIESIPILRTGIIRRKKNAVSKITPISSVDPKAQTTQSLKTDTRQSAISSGTNNQGIRLGLVVSDSADVFKKINESLTTPLEEEADKKKPKKPGSEKENQARQFRATDFRKRELVFQPKKKRITTSLHSKTTLITKPKQHKRILKMYNTISIEELSHMLGVKKIDVINKIRKEGLLKEDVKTLQSINYEMATLIANLFDFEVKNLSQTKEDIVSSLAFGDLKASLVVKPPVVTVMGHVNHGKTTLLDTIRKSRVADEEAGGITQHIGAYTVPVQNSFVTFIDTPGHSAFTKMRARGVQVTDIVVIVVSADDGIQPQTIEAISHAQSAKVPIIVAINKIDLPSVDLDKIKKQMMEKELVPEEWGGDTIFCPVSARSGKGVKELLEHIHLLAEVHELKANPKRSAKGVVLESYMRRGRGQVMSVLVQDGTLKIGQVIMTSQNIGRAREIIDDKGKSLVSAGPGQPVEISGFHHLTNAGDYFYAVKDEKTAKKWLAQQIDANKAIKNSRSTVSSAEDLLQKAYDNSVKTLSIILKTDGEGSREAIQYSLEKLSTKEVKAKIIHAHLGNVNENDVLLASAGQAVILCFNVGIDSKAQKLANNKNIVIQSHPVIYNLLESTESLMASLLDPEVQELFGGRAEVKEVFRVSHIGRVAGCKVLKGKINSDHFIRIIRDEQTVCEEQITSLKQFKQSVKSVSEGQECGIGLNQYKDFQPGDILESFVKKEIKRTKL